MVNFFLNSHMNSKKATLIGLSAILLWSTIVALIKEVTSAFGVIGGAAFMYSIATIILFFSFGWTPIKSFPKKYLIWGGLLFVAYELCLSLSIGYTNTNKQAIEVGMVNYLWPSFTILFAVLIHQQRCNALIIPGMLLSMTGICLVLSGDGGFELQSIVSNVQMNALSYALALLGVFLWASYCTLTATSSDGKNGITLFFMVVAVVLWVKWFFSGEMLAPFEIGDSIYLVLAALAMGLGYGAWNIGIMHGNVTLLATASYFIPVLSALISAWVLHTHLGLSFWKGALMVCLGSLLCWMATRNKQSKLSA